MTVWRGRWIIYKKHVFRSLTRRKIRPPLRSCKNPKKSAVKMVLVMMTVDEDNGNGSFAPGREGFLKQVLAG